MATPASTPEEPLPRLLSTFEFGENALLKVKGISMHFVGNVSVVDNCFSACVDLDLEWRATLDEYKKWKADPTQFVPAFVPNVIAMNGKSLESKLVHYHHLNKYAIRVPIDKETGKPDGRYSAWNHCRLRFHGEFTERFDMSHFPCDVQDLSVTFAISFFTASQLHFELCNNTPHLFTLSTRYTALPDWDPVRVHAFTLVDPQTPNSPTPAVVNPANASEYGPHPDMSMEYGSRLKIKVQVKRNCYPYLVRIFIPCLLLNALQFGIFTTDEAHERVNITVTVVLSYVALIFTLTSLIPVAGHVTIADQYVLMSIAASVFGLCVSLVSCYYDRHMETTGEPMMAMSVPFYNDLGTADTFAFTLVVVNQVAMHCYLAVCMVRAVRKENNKLRANRAEVENTCRQHEAAQRSIASSWPHRFCKHEPDVFFSWTGLTASANQEAIILQAKGCNTCARLEARSA